MLLPLRQSWFVCRSVGQTFAFGLFKWKPAIFFIGRWGYWGLSAPAGGRGVGSGRRGGRQWVALQLIDGRGAMPLILREVLFMLLRRGISKPLKWTARIWFAHSSSCWSLSSALPLMSAKSHNRTTPWWRLVRPGVFGPQNVLEHAPPPLKYTKKTKKINFSPSPPKT